MSDTDRPRRSSPRVILPKIKTPEVRLRSKNKTPKKKTTTPKGKSHKVQIRQFEPLEEAASKNASPLADIADENHRVTLRSSPGTAGINLIVYDYLATILKRGSKANVNKLTERITNALRETGSPGTPSRLKTSNPSSYNTSPRNSLMGTPKGLLEYSARNRHSMGSAKRSRSASVVPEEVVPERRSSPRLRGEPPAPPEKINARKSLGTPEYKKLIQKRRMKKQFERVQDDYQEDEDSSSSEEEDEDQDDEGEEDDGDGYEDDMEDRRKVASTPGSNKRSASAASTPGSGKRLKSGPGKFVSTPKHHVAVSSSKILSEDYFRDLSTAKRSLSNNTCMHSISHF
jgi:hypothetical protein